VAKNKKVSHSRIEKTLGGFKDSQTGNVWPTLEDMVFKCALTLKTPLPNSRTDIYVFQKELGEPQQNGLDNYTGLSPDEDEDDGEHYAPLTADEDLEDEDDVPGRSNHHNGHNNHRTNGHNNHRTNGNGVKKPQPPKVLPPAGDNYGIMDYDP